MYQEERLIEIIHYLKEHQRISVDDICEQFDVSRDTARRDLVKLEEQKAIVRTRGGAILPAAHKEIKDYRHRLHTVSAEKRQIGRKAASLIKNGDTLILDASTTVQACADQMEEIPCTVMTNSINLAEILSHKSDINIELLGGHLHKEHRFLYGTSVVDKLSHYFVDQAFVGVVGISEHGLTIAHEEDGMVKRKMIQQAKQVIVLADHTKIGVTEYFQYAELKDVDLLITDRIPTAAFQQALKEQNVELLVTEEEGK
ncbi:DeoR/GlpR family DNA-binding transcription regulator [Halobacillus salinarum]|uniref:DeoR/GlpR family DNA-binding transcription regulator n=1 Tax=Halobacillus salinarum TaxID=2932257 RepID=A0ABY4EQL2_9BACI|nr:DeoR/GlpR family DNA-binding transcription regulator [Halobacillus salinarum]UOQ46366.1 DeoR/GlpR family DNA-binding transcription regulator [Halobacillus salinarum]